jgi:dTDP-4-dehydrorhamnose reductase
MPIKILILGATGLLGAAIFHVLNKDNNLDVSGTIRNPEKISLFNPSLVSKLYVCADVRIEKCLVDLLEKIKPNVVINCISLDGNKLKKSNPLDFIFIYSVLPHKLAEICNNIEARLVNISSDGVFSGEKGNYREDDIPDASDIYGLSKRLGEVNHPNSITLRTSMIGPDLSNNHGLLSWFLKQQGRCNGYTKAIFSGLPTVVLAEIIRDFVIVNPNLSGIYHVAASPISKFNLLREIAFAYEKSIEIIPDDKVVIDRSLNAERFHGATGYIAPDWPTLIATMKLRS